MKFYNNIKIGGKLAIGFGVVIVLMLGMLGFAVHRLTYIISIHQYLRDFHYPRREATISYNLAFQRLQTESMYIVASSVVNNIYEMNEGIARVYQERDNAIAALSQNIYLVNTSTRINPVEQEQRRATANAIIVALNQYIDNVVVPSYQAALLRQSNSSRNILTNGTIYLENVLYYSTYFANISNIFNTNLSNELTHLTDTMWSMIIGVSALLLVIAVIFGVLTTGSIIKPINELVDLAKNVSQGNININKNDLDITSNELGQLTKEMYNMAFVIRDINDDILELIYQFSKKGDFEYSIDTSKYQNAFKELMEGVNSIISTQSDDMGPVIEALQAISDGKFDITVKDFPGKKIIVPNLIHEVLENLSDITQSINYAAKEISSGNLDIKLEPNKFNGNWKDLIISLQNLVTNVAEPIKIVETSLKHMQQGDFEKSHIKQNFSGTFENLKKALNSTERMTLIYINEISRVLEEMAKGDFTIDIKLEFVGNYEPIKNSIETILTKLRKTIEEIQNSADQVFSGAQSISNSSMNLAQGAVEQNQAIADLTVNMMHISAATSESSANAESANDKAYRSAKTAKQGGQSVTAMVDTMGKTRESSEDIAKIIKVIEDISFQTNLIALNAAVEAARAGEHGRGFSVVAEEVRNLAGKSSQNAKNTVKIMEENHHIVAEGIKASQDVQDSFSTIINDINQINKIVSDIAKRAAQQSQNIQVINTSVKEISKVVQDNSSSAEETASAAEELSIQAETLQELLSQFKV